MESWVWCCMVEEGVSETQGHPLLHKGFHTIGLHETLSFPTFSCPPTKNNNRNMESYFFVKQVVCKIFFIISRHSWGYVLHIISENCNRSERTKLKMRGYSKKQIGIDQLDFSRKWWITCDSRHISLWLLLLFCGKRTTPYICW